MRSSGSCLMTFLLLGVSTVRGAERDVEVAGTNPPPASSAQLRVSVLDRTTFIRMEKSGGMELTVANDQAALLDHGSLSAILVDEQGRELDRKTMPLPVIAACASGTVNYALDTSGALVFTYKK